MRREDGAVTSAARLRPRQWRYRLLLLVALLATLVLRLAVAPRVDTGAPANVVNTLYVVLTVIVLGLSIAAVVERVRSHGTQDGQQPRKGGVDG